MCVDVIKKSEKLVFKIEINHNFFQLKIILFFQMFLSIHHFILLY